SAVMGLTMKCARCHSHKFDPIPQRDYYRLIAIFKGAYDEYDWLKPDVHPGIGPVSQDMLSGRHLPYVTASEREAWQRRNDQIRREIDKLQAARGAKEAALSAQRYVAAKLPESLRPHEKRLKAAEETVRKESAELQRQIQELQKQMLPEPRVQALWDR